MARSFNGTTDLINFGSGVNSPTAITLSLWAYFITLPGVQTYLALAVRNDGTNFYSFLVNAHNPGPPTTGLAPYVVCTGGQVAYDPGAASGGSNLLTAGQWYHLAMTYSSSAGLIGYVNGVSDNTVAANGTMKSVSANLEVSNDTQHSGREVNMRCADFAQWNIALSSSQITQLFNGVRPINVNSANLDGWWPLDGFASPESDLSGNGNTGALTGTSPVLGPPALWRISG